MCKGGKERKRDTRDPHEAGSARNPVQHARDGARSQAVCSVRREVCRGLASDSNSISFSNTQYLAEHGELARGQDDRETRENRKARPGQAPYINR